MASLLVTLLNVASSVFPFAFFRWLPSALLKKNLGRILAAGRWRMRSWQIRRFAAGRFAKKSLCLDIWASFREAACNIQTHLSGPKSAQCTLPSIHPSTCRRYEHDSPGLMSCQYYWQGVPDYWQGVPAEIREEDAFS